MIKNDQGQEVELNDLILGMQDVRNDPDRKKGEFDEVVVVSEANIEEKREIESVTTRIKMKKKENEKKKESVRSMIVTEEKIAIGEIVTDMKKKLLKKANLQEVTRKNTDDMYFY